ncbi:MAG: helix-turn-helix transcriptional regulator [Clostridia bacterium]|nr:helix-turn-helix transcriptional regulator [Clostridia bacterium]
MKNYGEALKQQRLISGYTQEQVSNATGIAQSNLSAWENNVYDPTIEFCIILADFYDISLDELVGRDIHK